MNTIPAHELDVLPRDFALLNQKVQVVGTPREAAEMLAAVRQIAVAYAGIDAEYGAHRQRLLANTTTAGLKEDRWFPLTDLIPLLVSLCIVGLVRGSLVGLRYVLRVDEPAPVNALAKIVAQRPLLVGHFLDSDLQVLQRLGIRVDGPVWDTGMAASALSLGRYHVKYYSPDPDNDPDGVNAAELQGRRARDLVAVAATFGRPHPFADQKARLQASFLPMASSADCSPEQLDYSAADAVIPAQLYPLLVTETARAGIRAHLESIEFPAIPVLARARAGGLRVHVERRDRAHRAVVNAASVWACDLKDRWGVSSARSASDLKAAFAKEGSLWAFEERFGRRVKLSFTKDRLTAIAAQGSLAEAVLLQRKYARLVADRCLQGAFDEPDGFIRPRFQLLGADTGRITTSSPNVLGLGKLMRPIVIPRDGYLIGEADYVGQEFAAAMALFTCPEGVRTYHVGDPYAGVAQRLFASELTSEARAMPPDDFKARFKGHRDRVKLVTLALLYGMGVMALAAQLGCSVHLARALIRAFEAMFPELARALAAERQLLSVRGFAQTITGLKRFRKATGPLSGWEQRWASNFPIQGSCASVLKRAIVVLEPLYDALGARILVPFYDALVFEAPAARFDLVAAVTRDVMASEMSKMFPGLQARVELNVSGPTCWNAKGCGDSVEKFLADPRYKL